MGWSIWRRARVAVTIVVLAGCICAVAGYGAYPGFARGFVQHVYYSTSAESRNLYACVDYWLTYMEALSFDDDAQMYGFADAYEAAGDDGQRGIVAYHQGDFDDAVTQLERSIADDGESEDKLFWLALSYLRRAEADNCLATLLGDRPPPTTDPDAVVCTLPLQCCHQSPESALQAGRLFARLLDNYDQDNALYRWLLNFSHMAAGGFPDSVPERYRIESEFIARFHGESQRENTTGLVFRDEARELNVDTLDTGRGVAVEDFDRDGYLDIVTGGSFHDLKFYRNDGGKTFINDTAKVGLDGVLQPFCISAADYDNDGWVDLLVARPFDYFVLLRNEEGTFRDVTGEAGLLTDKGPDEVAATWISAWSDVDRDGDLDLFLAQWGMALPMVKGLMARPRMDSKLFINEGGRFTDRTTAFGLGGVVKDNYFIGATFGDYNDDGYPDLFLSSPLRNTSVLLRNDGGTEFAVDKRLWRAEGGFVAAFVDVNQDGRLDLFQSGFGDARTSTEQAVFGQGVDEYLSGHSAVFVQTADNTFEEQRDFFGQFPMSTMGANYGDLNNDGALDFYLGTGTPEGWFLLPNLMFLGHTDGTRCTGQSTDISALNGFGTIQKGHGIVFFDFDEDGDQDVYSSLGGMWPGDAWPNQFFVNHSELDNAWVKIRLRGRETNYYGVGAKIRVTAVSENGAQVVRYYHMDNKTGFGSAPYLAHIGLQDAKRIEEIAVTWPVSGQTRIYEGKIDSWNHLDESGGLAMETNASTADELVVRTR